MMTRKHNYMCMHLCTYINFVLLQIYNKGIDSSWIGYMTGQIEFNTDLISNKATAIMKLKSRDDYNKHTIFTGGTIIILSLSMT